ncbi:hypothetical protein OHV05_21025 [Kitasatospora sp. NBC_00070]|uniref:hypothetical protein n=1 Tax=Kitasatospora sp. NBC_00070 TaxID=2975962 RepID=UPI0032526553
MDIDPFGGLPPWQTPPQIPEEEKARTLRPVAVARALYQSMIYEENKAGRLDLGVNDGRNGLLYLWALIQHVNVKSCRTFVSDTTVAEHFGFESRNHGFKQARELAEAQGVIRVHGKKGRAWEVSLTVPTRLKDEYPELWDCTISPTNRP